MGIENMGNYEWRVISGEFARLYSTFTFGNMIIHSCFETTNVIANSFSNIGFIYTNLHFK